MIDPNDLAERVGPKLAELVHPGDDDVPPFPLSLPTFQPNVLPEGMAEAEAEELGLPTLNLNKLFLEALFALLQREYGVELVDARELADLRAAAAPREHKRNEVKRFMFECGQPAFRVMVKDFDSDNPVIPCATDEVQAGHKHG